MMKVTVCFPSTFFFFFPFISWSYCADTDDWHLASFFFPVYVWFIMFSCCLQKQKAVCPLHYLTPLHFRSTVGEKLKDIVPPPSQKWPKSLVISLIVILFVLNALTSLQAERVVAIVRFTRFFVCAVHISTQRLSTHVHSSLVFVLNFLSSPLLFPHLIVFQCSSAANHFCSCLFQRCALHANSTSCFLSLIS